MVYPYKEEQRASLDAMLYKLLEFQETQQMNSQAQMQAQMDQQIAMMQEQMKFMMNSISTVTGNLVNPASAAAEAASKATVAAATVGLNRMESDEQRMRSWGDASLSLPSVEKADSREWDVIRTAGADMRKKLSSLFNSEARIQKLEQNVEVLNTGKVPPGNKPFKLCYEHPAWDEQNCACRIPGGAGLPRRLHHWRSPRTTTLVQPWLES